MARLYLRQAWAEWQHGRPGRASLVNVVEIHQQTGWCRAFIARVIRDYVRLANDKLGAVLPLPRPGRRPRQ